MSYVKKFTIFFVSILAILFLSACAQETVNSTVPSDQERVTASPICTTPPPEIVDFPDFDLIKTEVDAYIQDFGGYRDHCETKEVCYDVSTEGGTVTGYYMQDGLRYMEVCIYGEMFRCRYDVYYISESLTYLVSTDIEYDMPYYMEGCMEEKSISRFIIFEHALYVYSDRVIPTDKETADNYKILIQDFERSLQEPISKDEIISLFTENYAIFESIVDYARKTEGFLDVYYYKKAREIISNSEVEIDEIVFNNIETLLNDLYFYRVSEVSNGDIYFMRYTYGQGICCSKNPLNPESYNEIVEMGNGWYYYRTPQMDAPINK